MTTMSPRLSKAMLTTHITFSAGWVGTVAAFLVLAIVGLLGRDQVVGSCYIAMEVIAWFVIVPFCAGSFLSGLIQGLGTYWGLFKHWWILVKLILTIIATVTLMLHMQPISYLGALALEKSVAFDGLQDLRIRIIADAGAAMLVLVAITTVSVYKPWGKIRFGIALPDFKPTTKRPMGKYLLVGLVIALLIFALLHFMKGGIHHS